jgi:hypothetical protein
MDDEAGRLVDHRELVVAVGEAHGGNRSGSGPLCGHRVRWQLDALAALQPVALRPQPPVDEGAALDRALRRPARPQVLGEEAVEALAGGLRGDVELPPARGQGQASRRRR